jgi:hypothetical protein
VAAHPLDYFGGDVALGEVEPGREMEQTRS